MAVSKSLRYEVMRRDNHVCRYCGATAPDVKLTIDHVIPVTLGGSDKPENLVTACADCNAGKKATPPGAPLINDVSREALLYASCISEAVAVLAEEREYRQRCYDAFDEKWKTWTNESDGSHVSRPDSWRDSVDQFLASRLPRAEVWDAIDIAMRANAEDTWRYFCGVVWKKVTRLQDIAADIYHADSNGAV